MALASAALHTAATAALPTETVDQVLDVAPVWAGHPVGFCLLTRGDHQFAAFYDAQRRMTVASRLLSDKTWRFVRLPEVVGWDSHNYITMALDDDGFIHLSGNMHVAPLVYFRSEKPLDIESFKRVPAMVGPNEKRATYPVFFRGPDNELIFTYRDGSSGNGNEIYNRYDPKTRAWSRLLDKPLTDGEGHRNAYLSGPTKGPDGFYHLAWVWRESPDCSSNHDPSYARSPDLLHWENSAGKPLSLPITLQTGEIVDPVPVHGGVINGDVVVGFDSEKRPVVSYIKYDANGNTQIYNARVEDGHWSIHQASGWNYRWDFSGGGSIPFEVHVGAVKTGPGGVLTQQYSHLKLGSGTWILDPVTLKPVGHQEERPGFPPELGKLESKFPGMQVKWAGDSGASGDPGVRYVLRWETLGPNRDRPREGDPPPPGMLRVYKLQAPGPG